MNTYQKIMTGILASSMTIGCGNVKAKSEAPLDNRPYHKILMERNPSLICYDASKGYEYSPFAGISEKWEQSRQTNPEQSLDEFLSTYKAPIVDTIIEQDKRRSGAPRSAVCTEKSNPAKISITK